MVRGIQQFAAHFSAFAGEYVIIGGTACTMLLERMNISFRATKDIDMVLTMNSENKAFVQALWEYIVSHGYQHVNHATGNSQFYRFEKPEDEESPWMIELFSRVPVGLEIAPGHLTPIPVDDDVSSLSAILLDEEYYALVVQGRRVVEGVPVLEASHLMMLKAKAWCDLTDRKALGQRVDHQDISKHKNDIFRLFGILPTGEVYSFSKLVMADFNRFLDWVEQNPASINMKTVQMPGIDVLKIVREMRSVFKTSD